jgi:DNA-binding Xre family transcriptional regulator
MKKKDEKWFDHRLKEIGRNKSDLARYLGVDRAVVTRLISGDQRVTVEHVEKMCLFLEASPTKVLAACGVDFGTNKNKTWLADASDDDDRRKSRISIKDGDDGIEWSVPEYLRQEVGISDPAKC